MSSEESLYNYIAEDFDSKDLTSWFLFQANSQLSEAGIRINLKRDFDRYMDINRANRDTWFPAMPLFDPEASRLESRAFFLEAREVEGDRTIGTVAARCYTLIDSTLKEEIESLRLFHRDPSHSAAADESCNCEAPGAARLSGRICYSGGGWVHPEFRGQGLTLILPRISRVLAHRLWKTDYTVSLVEPVLAEKGVVCSYGYRNIEPGVAYCNLHGEALLELYLVWMDRAEMLLDIGRSMLLNLAGLPEPQKLSPSRASRWARKSVGSHGRIAPVAASFEARR